MQIHQQRAERPNLERIARGFGDPADSSEQVAIVGLWRSARHHAANSLIDAAGGPRLITSGWAGWVRYADNGQRLILLFLMPGDFIVRGLFDAGCCDLVCLSPMKTIDASPLAGNGSFGSTPKSAALIAGSGRQYRLLLVDHLTRLINGCTTSSLASLLVEFHDRALRAGACDNGRFTMPIGQRILARSLGRSSVQINKVMTHFQAEGWIKVGYDWVSVLAPEALRKAAGMINGGRMFAPPLNEADPIGALTIDRLEPQL